MAGEERNKPGKHILLVTGGQRSGKSDFAQNRALEMSKHPVYLATSRIWDEEFRQRVLRHQANRGPEWTNVEEEKFLSRHDLAGRVIDRKSVVFDNNSVVDISLQQIKEEFDAFVRQDAYFIFVTNELGLGGVSVDDTQRRFTDLQGWVNQYIASKADEVVLMVSGIPVPVK